MSASVTSSSRRRPVRATRSSIDANARAARVPRGAQSCEQLLQNHVARPSTALEHRLDRRSRTSDRRERWRSAGLRRTGGTARPRGLRMRAIACPASCAQSADVAQPEADRAVGFDGAVPVRHLHVDRMEADAAALRVLDQRRRMVEPHRLVVEERRVERRRVMHLEIRARVGEQREAGGVRLGKAVQRERGDRRDDLLRRLAGDALAAPCPRAAAPRSASSASRIA